MEIDAGKAQALMEIITSKMEEQDIHFEKLLAGTNKIAQLANQQQQLTTMLEQLTANEDSSDKEQLNRLEMSLQKLLIGVAGLGNNQVKHHYHLPKLLWYTAGLFLSFCGVCSGWYITSGKLSGYAVNDIKYRYLKQTGSVVSLKELYRLDSLASADHHLQDSVTHWEKMEQQAFELHQKMNAIKTEKELLEQQAKQLESKKKRRQ